MKPSSRAAEKEKAELQRIQARNMRFADEYVGRLSDATRRVEGTMTDPKLRLILAGWLLDQANSAYIVAAGENPKLSSLDLLTLATLSRMVTEDSVAQKLPTPAAKLLPVQRQMEQEAWQLAGPLLSPSQQASVRELFAKWAEQNPGVGKVAFVRFQDFVTDVQVQSGRDPETFAGGLLGVIGIDPLSGLDPAVRQVEQTRLVAERAIFYAQRMPVLLDLQLEAALSRVAATPETQQLLRETSSFTNSAQRFTTVAAGLPDAFAREREALIGQLSTELTRQQATLLPLLTELRTALEAGDTTATSVNQAVRSIDALVARIKTPPPGAAQAPGKPFDITQYTQTAQEITRAANQLQQLLTSAGGQTQSLDAALDAARKSSQTLVDHLFVRIAELIGLFLAGILITALAYRWLAVRLAR